MTVTTANPEPAGQRTSPRVVLVHTVTFRQARQFVPAAALLYAVVTIGIRPWIRFRVHRWEVTADAVYTLTGWLTRTWTLVPISRIQTVDVTRGVLQQMFGLATVAVLTASSQGTVQIWHLEHDVAQRVADDLAHRAEHVRDEAT